MTRIKIFGIDLEVEIFRDKSLICLAFVGSTITARYPQSKDKYRKILKVNR